jgi:hypothetical protein
LLEFRERGREEDKEARVEVERRRKEGGREGEGGEGGEGGEAGEATHDEI